MSNVSYDLDTSGGLMPFIRAIIKPPDEDLIPPKPKKPQHPYYKRPGKGHNHDSCDACGEGGDLICCDRCPASFHLGCYDPPLEVSDIPTGLWLCRECCAADEKQSSSRSSRAQSPADKSDTEKRTRSSTSAKKKEDDKESDEEKEAEEAKEPEEEKKELTPMEILVNAAKIMNPKQFELPREMRIPLLFPGTEKEGSKNGNATVINVDAWGCVPLPAKACYVCRATCKAAPLLQCDYCPLLFHQDCLDPPLTALPTGRWMCPNHVEKYIDWKLVNSISATERVALWDQFSAPVDQHAIKIDFIRRARRARPAFRLKAWGYRGRVVVPAMVRLHYRRRAPLLPSRREHVRCTNVLKKLQSGGVYSESDEEGEEPHRICMNTGCPQYSGGACPLRPASEDDANDDLDAIAAPQKFSWRKLRQYPRVQGWFLFDTPLATLAMVIAYLAFVLVAGPLWMANKKPFRIQSILVAYNAGQVLLSLYMFYEHLASGWWGDYSLACQPVDYSDSDKARRMLHLCWVYYFSKLSEFADTIFFVLRKKKSQITWLHLYHHALTPFEAWLLVKFIAGGHGTFSNVVNNLVHVIMYSYYMTAALGPQYHKYLWWKKHLTTLQLVQFFMVLFHSISALLYDCGYPKLIASGLILHSTIFIVLFTNFYMHAYKKEKAKPIAVNNNNKGEGIPEDIKPNEHTNGHVKVNGHMCNGVNGHIANGYISNGTLSNGVTKASLQELHDDISLYETKGNSVNGHILNYSSTEKEKMQ